MKQFSLIEIIVTIIVLTVMASIAYPVATIEYVREKESELKDYLSDFRNGITEFKNNNPGGGATGAYVVGDDDGDGLTDEEMDDGVDNDGDGLIDEDVAVPGYPLSLKQLVLNHCIRRIHSSPFSGGKWQYRISISEDIYQYDDFSSSVGSWTVGNGSFVLNSGKYELNVQGAGSVAYDGNILWKHYYVEGKITILTTAGGGNDYAAIGMRYDSAGPDMYELRLMPNRNAGAGEVVLAKTQGGALTELQTWAIPIAAGTEYYCKIQVESTTILVWVGSSSTLLGVVNDPGGPVNGFACVTGENATAQFDDITVSSWKDFLSSTDKEVSESDDDIYDVRLFYNKKSIGGTYYYSW